MDCEADLNTLKNNNGKEKKSKFSKALSNQKPVFDPSEFNYVFFFW